MSEHAFGLLLFMFSMIASAVFSAEDDYLQALEAEAEKLAPPSGERRPAAAVITKVRGDRERFESEIGKYKGTYSFYKRLQEKDRAEVFKAYQEGASIAKIRRMIVDRIMHR
jgi:hypothetical protein